MTKSQIIAEDCAAVLRARNPLIWIVTKEEARVEGYLAEAAGSAGYVPRTWDVAGGVCNIDGTAMAGVDAADPGDVLNVIKSRAESGKERGVWILRDMPVWLEGPPGATPLRRMRNLARYLPGVKREGAQAMIVLSPSGKVPDELADHATVIEWPLPDRDEIASILDAAIENIADAEKRAAAAPNGSREAAIDAAVGLTGEEAAACYARSLVQLQRIDSATVANEKKRVIARDKLLEWYDPLPGGLDAVGGLDNLKAWLLARTSAYSPAARQYGLPLPKGVMVAGISGCGKSLIAKAIATGWGVPLLRLDLGALKSKFVGDSEANLRKALKVIEAIGRCVVWLDEVEKALQGATSGSSDGGVSADALGAILTWMEERRGGAFVIATSNDIEVLPPEFLRKGRFDEVFWVDLPNATDRVSILSAALRSHGRAKIKIDLADVADATDGFNGAEVASIVPDSLFAAFADKAREITTADLIASAGTIVPLSKTAEVKITKMREWAKDRARPAARAEVTTGSKSRGRKIDM